MNAEQKSKSLLGKLVNLVETQSFFLFVLCTLKSAITGKHKRVWSKNVY